DLGDGHPGSLPREPVGGRRADARMELGLEPRQLVAVGEDDPADGGAVDLAAGEDAVAPALAQRRVELLVVAVELVDDVVGGDRRGTGAREPLQPRALPRRDAARQRDRKRPHGYSSDGSVSDSAAGSSAAGSSTTTASTTGSSASASAAG